MTETFQTTSREILDIIIQRTILIYRWAVFVTFALLGVGFAIAIAADQELDAEMAFPQTLFRQIIDLEASGYIGAGISVMIITPIVMIASAALTFQKLGDSRYALITSGVAVILSLSIVISFVTG